MRTWRGQCHSGAGAARGLPPAASCRSQAPLTAQHPDGPVATRPPPSTGRRPGRGGSRRPVTPGVPSPGLSGRRALALGLSSPASPGLGFHLGRKGKPRESRQGMARHSCTASPRHSPRVSRVTPRDVRAPGRCYTLVLQRKSKAQRRRETPQFTGPGGKRWGQV